MQSLLKACKKKNKKKKRLGQEGTTTRQGRKETAAKHLGPRRLGRSRRDTRKGRGHSRRRGGPPARAPLAPRKVARLAYALSSPSPRNEAPRSPRIGRTSGGERNGNSLSGTRTHAFLLSPSLAVFVSVFAFFYYHHHLSISLLSSLKTRAERKQWSEPTTKEADKKRRRKTGWKSSSRRK